MITVRVVPPDRDEPEVRRGVLDLLAEVDHEFVPALSRRSDTESLADHSKRNLRAYADAMRAETWLVAIEGRRVKGLASGFLQRCVNDVRVDPYWHLTTIVVDPAQRRCGIGTRLYEALEALATDQGAAAVSTRTWQTNKPHLQLLSARGYLEADRIVDERGPGLDSVTFILRLPTHAQAGRRRG